MSGIILLLNNTFYMVLIFGELLCMQLHVIFKSVVFILLIDTVAIIINIAISIHECSFTQNIWNTEAWFILDPDSQLLSVFLDNELGMYQT